MPSLYDDEKLQELYWMAHAEAIREARQFGCCSRSATALADIANDVAAQISAEILAGRTDLIVDTALKARAKDIANNLCRKMRRIPEHASLSDSATSWAASLQSSGDSVSPDAYEQQIQNLEDCISRLPEQERNAARHIFELEKKVTTSVARLLDLKWDKTDRIIENAFIALRECLMRKGITR